MPKKGPKETLYQTQRRLRPHTKAERAKVAAACDASCFLAPQKKKYLVCDRECNFDCDLLRQAYMHAETWRKRKPDEPIHKKASAAAKKRAAKENCRWFRGAPFPGTKQKKSQVKKKPASKTKKTAVGSKRKLTRSALKEKDLDQLKGMLRRRGISGAGVNKAEAIRRLLSV